VFWITGTASINVKELAHEEGMLPSFSGVQAHRFHHWSEKTGPGKFQPESLKDRVRHPEDGAELTTLIGKLLLEKVYLQEGGGGGGDDVERRKDIPYLQSTEEVGVNDAVHPAPDLIIW
jgi:hypothetical protein